MCSSFAVGLNGSQSRAAGKGFGQPDELRHFADSFRKGFAGEFLAQLRFHSVGSVIYAVAARLPNSFCRGRPAVLDGGNAGSQALVLGDEENVRVVGRERLDVVDGRESAAERPVFDQSCRHQPVCRAQDIGQGQTVGWLVDCHDR